MMKIKKIKSYLRWFSPLLVSLFGVLMFFLLCEIHQQFYLEMSSLDILNCFSEKADKMGTVVGLDGTLIGELITVFIIYTSFPLSKTMRKRFKESKHHLIFIQHIWFGVIFFMISIFAYLLADAYVVALVSFCMGTSNLIATAYYITVLVSFIDGLTS